MSLAVPSALTLAALALPIVVFYILKVRLRRVPVSTNLFWNQIYDEKPPRSIWQHFRHLLSLLVQLMLLGLMVFALADPYFSWQALQARRIVAVIDTSASMQATDVSPNRFEASIDAAVNLVEGMRFRDKMAIVLTGTRPEVVLGMSDHIPTLKRTLRSLNVADNPTKVEEAIELGKQLIGDHPNGTVVVFTDGCASSLDPDSSVDISAAPSPTDLAEKRTLNEGADNNEQPKETNVEFRVFGIEASNVGITQFQVRRSLIDMLGYEVLVSVKNASLESVKCRLEIELSDLPVDVLPLTLKPNEVWSRSLEKTSLEGGVLVAKLSNFDTLSEDKDSAQPAGSKGTPKTTTRNFNSLVADDTAWALLPAQKVQNVLVVTKGNLFLRKVFEANPLVNVTVATEFPAEWPANTLIVIHGSVPETLPPGDVFVVDPADSCDAWELGEILENPIVTQVDSESDLMTHVRLDNVLMPEARKLKFKHEPHVLAGSLSDDPIYAQLKRGSGKGLVLSVNLERSDLAFRTAFPIMVTNALGWFAGSSGELRESASTGSIVGYELDTEVGEMIQDLQLVLSSPTGKERSVAHKKIETADVPMGENTQNDNTEKPSTSLSLGPFNERGIWSLQAKASDSNVAPVTVAELAVNISDQRETDLFPPPEILEIAAQGNSLSSWFAKPVWYYLVAVVSLLFVAEWFLYQRRFIS